MANDEHVERLRACSKQGAQAWNAWRAERTATTVDLSGAALRGLDLGGSDLSEADLQGADLRGAHLGAADLRGADLRGANLFKALIDGADMTAADLRGVQFLHCPQLESARNWQSAYRDDELACGASIPTR